MRSMKKILSGSTNVRCGIAEASALPQVSSSFQPAALLWRLGIGHSNTAGLCGVFTGGTAQVAQELCILEGLSSKLNLPWETLSSACFRGLWVAWEKDVGGKLLKDQISLNSPRGGKTFCSYSYCSEKSPQTQNKKKTNPPPQTKTNKKPENTQATTFPPKQGEKLVIFF